MPVPASKVYEFGWQIVWSAPKLIIGSGLTVRFTSSELEQPFVVTVTEYVPVAFGSMVCDVSIGFSGFPFVTWMIPETLI